ncbi:MAG: CPBP family intramembrane metalloprotease [Proteobacteria bacterium]|nr:CPBP family intramembrane metalloprotease [Pseudomonadota bacterium]
MGVCKIASLDITSLDITAQLDDWFLTSSQPVEERDQGGELPPLDVDGRLPSWVHWPTNLTADPIAVEVTHSGGQPKITILAEQHRARSVAARIELIEQSHEEASRRLDGLGIPDREKDLVDFVVEIQDWAPPFGSGWIMAAYLACLGWVTSANILLNVLPTERASGALETLRATRLSAQKIAWLWWVLGVSEMVLNLFVSLVGLVVGCMVFSPIPIDATVLALPLFFAPTIALGVRLFSRAGDLRAAVFLNFAFTLTIMALFGLSLALSSSPFAAAMVPLGGALLLSMGGLPWTTVFVVGVVNVPLTIWLLNRTAHLLEHETLAQGRSALLTGYLVDVLWLGALAIAANMMVQFLTYQNVENGVLVATVAQVLCFGLPGLLAPRLFGLDQSHLLQLHAPRWVNWALIPLFLCGTIASGVLAGQLMTAIYPVSPFTAALSQKILMTMSSPWNLVAMSFGPGLCEELLFRGAVLGLLRRSGRVVMPIVIQAAIFSLAHVHFFRLAPTFAIGLILGVIVWRTKSIWPAVVVHTLHNALQLGLLWYGPGEADLPMSWYGPEEMTLLMVPVLAIGLVGLVLARGNSI